MARFEHENKVQRKELKPEKKWNPPLFGIRNPLRWNPESSTRDPESTAWNPESKTVLDSLTWGEVFHPCSPKCEEMPEDIGRSRLYQM